MILPLNDHVHVVPIQKKSVIETQDNNFDECGTVVSAPEFSGINPSDVVYFDSWTAARYKDKSGEEFWLVPLASIRAKEEDV